MQKNDILNLEIIDNGIDFEAIAKSDGMTVFIPNGIIGEKVRAKILKVNKNYSFAKIEKIEVASPYRQEEVCEVYNKCGGCDAQHITYEFTLQLKTKMVKNCLDKQKVKYINLEKCIGMGLPYYYRNKVQYPVRVDKNGNTVMGFYAKRSHNIVQNECCYIQNRVIDMLSKEVFNILIKNNFVGYNEQDGTGDIRHIVIKRGTNTSDIMVVLVVNSKSILKDIRIDKVVKEIKSISQNIQGIFLNLNESRTNEILGSKTVCVYGKEYITERISDYTYYISPKSFFQVNTSQAEIMYHVLEEKLKLSKNDILFDLYSGVGSIGIFLSKNVAKVYGIEIEEEAVKMANMNIDLNNVTNCEYIAGSVEDKIEEFKKRNIFPDVIVVDPPRKGLDEKSIEYILNFRPQKIGYVSCNPATLVRDLKLLEKEYTILDITPIDMFPQTSNVECVAVLCLRENNKTQ